VTRHGRVARFSLEAHSEPSTRSGRRYMRVGKGDDGVVALYPCVGGEWVTLASHQGRALAFQVEDVNILKAAGKGVMAMKLRTDDRIFAFELSTSTIRGACVHTERGRELMVTPRRFGASRAGRGAVVLKRGNFVDWAREPVIILDKAEGEE
jgi:DNA gyrase subunit A